ncbi:MAG TPA: hypothetical protein PLL69_05420 [Gemmatimonadales bacterium]|nr:hypothetical protein [Gemmatimonadales bacterium]
MRRLVPLALIATLAACPTYDSRPYLSTQKGLLDADQWAGYGPEQAVAVAIGREFAHLSAGEAADYGRKFESVKEVDADSLGHRLVVTFNSGWHAQVTPIKDGKRGDETKGVTP